jgi:hypothetical protein
MNRWMKIGGTVLAAAIVAGISGCSTDGAPSLLPNPDASLRKSSAELAADAAKREYENQAPRAGSADARAQYELMQRRLDLVNLSKGDWSNVEVWVNQKYVLFIPRMQQGVDKKLDFEMFYDRDGHHFDTQNGKRPFQSLEICLDGKLYSVTATME